jgi:hypothetical protein
MANPRKITEKYFQAKKIDAAEKSNCQKLFRAVKPNSVACVTVNSQQFRTEFRIKA